MGGAQEQLVRPVVARAPGAVPVLVGVSPERLVQARDALLPVEGDGLRHRCVRAGLGAGTAGPPALIGITALLGSVPDRKKEAFLQEAVAALAPDGILIWADLFLPQTLALYERYQTAEAEALCGLEPGLTMEAAIRRVADTQRVLYGSPVLLERAPGDALCGRLCYCGHCLETVRIRALVAAT
jgi:hypothetical protein